MGIGVIADMRFSTHVLWSLLSLDRKTIKTGNRSNDTLYYEKIGLRPITGTFEYSLFHERRFTCWKQNRGFKSLSTSESSFLTLKTVKKTLAIIAAVVETYLINFKPQNVSHLRHLNRISFFSMKSPTLMISREIAVRRTQVAEKRFYSGY